ncbi:hypothetical protein V8J82_21830 [Gymnodinialimonas sp. 2305UL16-5]|uniref:hypothetical protein n=1 Tax=Gymnodinialimonas mytili TaxID=3126503 RepID=UPI0030AEB491
MKTLKKPFGGALTFASLTVALMLMPLAAQAYVGPGAGLTAIGTMIALVAALVLAVVGFVWYPMKRMMRKRKSQQDLPTAAEKQR